MQDYEFDCLLTILTSDTVALLCAPSKTPNKGDTMDWKHWKYEGDIAKDCRVINVDGTGRPGCSS